MRKLRRRLPQEFAIRSLQQEAIDYTDLPQTLRDSGELNYSELTGALLDELLKNRISFKLRAVSDLSVAVRRVEMRIEELGMKCRVYTEYRAAAGGAALFTGVGLAAAAAIAAHNLVTWDPDYEIGKNKISNTLSVTCKKPKPGGSSGPFKVTGA